MAFNPEKKQKEPKNMDQGQKPKASGPINKLILIVLAIGAAGIMAVGGFLLFGIMGLMLGGAVAVVGLVLYFVLFYMRNFTKKPMLQLEHAVLMDIFETTMMADLPTPVPLKVFKDWEHSSVMSHPGDVFGRTKLPVDPEFFTMVGDEPIIPGNKPNKELIAKRVKALLAERNTVWAYRMRRNEKSWSPFNKNDQFIALVCQSQIHDSCLGPDGDIQFNTPIIASGMWSKYGAFYILWNSSKELALAHAAIDTVKMAVSYREQTNRLAEAGEGNSRSNMEIIHQAEKGKDVVDIITGED